MNPKILVVDNEERMVKLVKASLELEGFDTDGAFSAKSALELLEQNSYDIIITDLKMQHVDGLQLLQHVKENQPACEVILMTAYASQETALEAMQKGAYDYLIKPFKMDELVLRIGRIMRQKELEAENTRLKQQVAPASAFEGFIGKSAKMRHVFDLIRRVAESDATVLIRGESGSGKELVAKALHRESPRSNQTMVSINCAALPETLLESELFGYEKGAFTGAVKQKKGLFESADGGTLFLDEIGDLSLNLQAKLLRVLQNREIIRLGGTESIAVDVRLITATHKNLEQMMEEQSFRSDLYYRISTFPIALPPLRERKEDIPALISHFMQAYPDKALSSRARLKLMEYDYPGNVRELENIIARSAIVSEKMIEDVDLPAAAAIPQTEQSSGQSQLPPEGLDLDKHIAALLREALDKAGGNKTKAAKMLGITRRRLYSMLESYKIEN